MQLSELEIKFLTRRSALIRYWPYAGAAMLLIIGILAASLFWKNPLLINPFYVIAQIEIQAIPQSSLIMMAIFLPVLMLTLLGVLLVMVFYMFAVFANERKQLAIIAKLMAEE